MLFRKYMINRDLKPVRFVPRSAILSVPHFGGKTNGRHRVTPNGQGGESAMDTVLISAAYLLAGDGKYRLSSCRDKAQAPTLSFTYNKASNLIFLHLDGEFTHSRTGYHPDSNSLELYLDLHSASMLRGVLGNIVASAANPGQSPQLPPWKHGPGCSLPIIVEEYAALARAITITHPLNLVLRPRIPEGFTLYTALTHPRLASGEIAGLAFRLKFWLTEKSIPELELLRKSFCHDYTTRTQPLHATFTFSAEELSLLQCQLGALEERYIRETA